MIAPLATRLRAVRARRSPRFAPLRWASTSRRAGGKPPSDPPAKLPRKGSSSTPPSGAPPAAAPASLAVDNAVAIAAMRFFAYVVWWVRRFGVPSRDAEDVAQLVMLAVLPRWTSFVPWPGQLEGVARRRWLVGVAARQAANYRKRRTRPETPTTLEEMAEHGAPFSVPGLTAEELLMAHEDAAGTAAEVALTELAKDTTRERWTVFSAHKVDGLPMRAIAALEGIPLGTAYNRLRHARLDLRCVFRRDPGSRSDVTRAAVPT